MRYAGILLIAIINYFVVHVISVLAVGGDGSSDGVTMVRISGAVWIGAFAVTAIVFQVRGNGRRGLKVAASALPVAFGMLLVLNLFVLLLSDL
jgi:hypothetical protein